MVIDAFHIRLLSIDITSLGTQLLKNCYSIQAFKTVRDVSTFTFIPNQFCLNSEVPDLQLMAIFQLHIINPFTANIREFSGVLLAASLIGNIHISTVGFNGP